MSWKWNLEPTTGAGVDVQRLNRSVMDLIRGRNIHLSKSKLPKRSASPGADVNTPTSHHFVMGLIPDLKNNVGVFLDIASPLRDFLK